MLDAPDQAAYRSVAAQAPGDLSAALAMGRIARRRGDRHAALAWFDTAAAADPSDVWARLERAQELRALGRLDEAEAECRQILERIPDHPQAALGLGVCLLARERWAEALAPLQAAAAAAPTRRWAQLKIAEARCRLHRFGEAARDLEALLAEQPEDSPVLLALARMARETGDRSAARRYFERAVEAGPDEAAPLLELARELRDMGDAEAALRSIERLLRRWPDHLEGLLQAGVLERDRGQHAAALRWFERARDAHPAEPRVLLELADEERSAGGLGRADALLAEALALAPDSAPVIGRAAHLALTVDDPQTALTLLERGLAAAPDHLGLRLGACQALVMLGRADEALAALDRLEERVGGRPEIDVKRIALRQRTGDWHGALLLARARAGAMPDNFALWSARARLELLVAPDAEVAACLAAAPARTKRERAAARLLAGLFAERRWRGGEAVLHFEAAAAHDPENATVWFALTRAHLVALSLDDAHASLQQFCRLTQATTRLKGRSTNQSQTHFGQMLDEFRLDPTLADRLRRLAPMPPAERLAALLAMARTAPDSTAVAIRVVTTCREAGLMALAGRRAGPSPIGGPIVHYWDRPDVPADVLAIMESWRTFNPLREYRRFDDAAARAFLRERLGRDALLAYHRAAEPAQKADLFRLAFLAIEGGIYADADDRCVAALDCVLPGDAELVLYQEDLASIGNNFIACVPRHPVILHALEQAVMAMNRGDRDILWLSTGPGLITRAFAQVLASSPTPCRSWFARVAVLERHELAAAVATHCVAGYKRSEGHWHNTAFRRRTPVARGRPSTALPWNDSNATA